MNQRVREAAKLLLRRQLLRRNLGIAADPYVMRLARTVECLGVELVLDIGANVGQFGSLLRASGYRKRIVSCEPLTTAFQGLTARSRNDHMWLSLNTAVGSVAGNAILNVSGNSYSSSLRKMAAAHERADPKSRYVGEEIVPLTTVDTLLDDFGVPPDRVFLKVDTQGFEREVLAGGHQSLNELACVQLELSYTPLYDGQATAEELSAIMRKYELEFYSTEPGIADPLTGRMLQADALFVRRTRL